MTTATNENPLFNTLEKPLPEDCCGQGCNPCVFDIYEKELQLLRNRQFTTTVSQSSNSPTLNPEFYSSFELIDIIPITTEANIYRFKLPDLIKKENHTFSQHLLIKLKTDEKKIIIRPFTILKIHYGVQNHENNCCIDLLIKIYQDGRFTKILKRDWRVGDFISMKGPFSAGNNINLSYKRNMFKYIVMCAAGTGLAPMISFIDSLLEDSEEETWINLHYSSSSWDLALCKDDLKSYVDYWNFKLFLYLNNQSSSDESVNISATAIQKRKINPVSDLSNHDFETTLFLVCGPPKYEKNILSFLKTIKFASNVVKF